MRLLPYRELISVDDDYVAEHEAKILKEADLQEKILQGPTLQNAFCPYRWHYKFCGQNYKRSIIVKYDSRVVIVVMLVIFSSEQLYLEL